MDLQRLKFAWARGARIELRIVHAAEPTWLLANRNGFNWSGDYEFRIHSDDEDLQYGPLSTALREMALYRTLFDRWTDERCYQDAACKLVESFDPRGMNANLEDDVTLPTFLLFYAELLADEGL